MTDHADTVPRGFPGHGRSRWIVAGTLAVVVLAAFILWLIGRLPGAPLRPGPLEGTNYEELKVRTNTAETGILWGSLQLHNGTGFDVVLDKVTLADNPQNTQPSAGPYIWDTDRVALLNTGSVSGYSIPLPSDWKIPPRHSVKGFRIRPHAEEESVEVLYELPVPTRVTEVHGMTVRYHTRGLAYQRTYDISIIICPPSDGSRCKTS
ncbi:hypothetical protein [Paractinoplanes durhamensis]|uniref:Uncharacterized protein n=1 Tax=Paractinoplanes durhamensis TaxID=113563 RepID=A0ABQ3Z0T4_9ACTN|nr:hypothetical protein [Actinoplanes durhamensis]GIE03428.1 hypothetical protein Adu01nite_47780 [Actinoplanes durhamensis]